MSQKKFRPAAYCVLQYQDKIVLAQKTRGPFKGMFDLPGGGIEHGEDHNWTVKREVEEELGITHFEIIKLLDVFHHNIKVAREGVNYDQHMLGIIYFGIAFEKPLSGQDDSGELIFIDPLDMNDYELTPICKSALQKFLSDYDFIKS